MVRVGINGLGRIGRNVLRASIGDEDLSIVAVNDLANAEILSHLLKYDSIYGALEEDISPTPNGIKIDDHEIRVFSERDPAQIPWASMGVDVVVESTGMFTNRDKAALHLQAGAKKVIISSPADNPDITIVVGVNDDQYDPEKHTIISNASCTTNCLAPLSKVLLDNFGIERGYLTTIHAYTNDQRILDLVHSDLRRARAAAQNIIPTSTGAARAINLVIPELKGKMDGMAMRVPVPVGSLCDLTVVLGKEVSKEEVNAAFEREADVDNYEGILAYSEDPMVSTDVIGSSYSSVFDALSTTTMGNLCKVIAWYDNEWGYSCRILDLIHVVTEGEAR